MKPSSTALMITAAMASGMLLPRSSRAGGIGLYEISTPDVGLASAVDAVNPQSLTAELDYQDTWHGAVGAQFHASENWLLSTGFAYDSSAVNDEDRTLGLPMGEAYRIGLGAQWQVSQAINLGAACEFMWMGDLPVSQDSVYRGRVSGSFNDSWFSFFNLNLTWQF